MYQLKRFRSATVAATVLGAVVSACEIHPSGDIRTSASSSADAECVARERSREALVLRERPAYVESTALSAGADGDILLLGTPNYTADGTNALLGAVLPRTGPARPVEHPIDSPFITGIRATARADRGWDVVFAEHRPSTKPAPPDTAVQLWHAVHDGDSWLHVQRLPMLLDRSTLAGGASRLIRQGDTLTWGVRVDSDGQIPRIMVYERRDGQWRHELTEIRGVYVELGWSPLHGLVLATVRANAAFADDMNSLFLYAKDDGWTNLGVVIRGGQEPVHHPALDTSPAGVRLTWWSTVQDVNSQRRELRSLLNAPGTDVVIVDSSAAEGFVSLSSSATPHLWVVDHHSPVDQREIRIIHDSDVGPTVLRRQPNPFQGPFAGTMRSATEFSIVGPLFDPEEPSLVSLVLNFDLDCAGANPVPQTGGES